MPAVTPSPSRRRARPLVRPHGARTARRGVSIVEMIVAIVVLVIGIIGLASTAAMVARQMGGGTQQTIAATVAQARFETLAAASCTALLAAPSGTATGRGVTERWRVVAGANGTLAIYDTLSYVTNRGTRTVGYASMRSC
jgi:Tfp pilus assembly protein PilV